MSDQFLSYLRAEHRRLEDALAQVEEALAQAQAADGAHQAELGSLRRQKRIVEDQLAKWTADLRQEAIAA